MGAELPEVFVLPTVTITLHDILVATVTRVLVADESVERGGSADEMSQEVCCCESLSRLVEREQKKRRWLGNRKVEGNQLGTLTLQTGS